MATVVTPTRWPAKDPAEAFPVSFDFGDALIGAESISAVEIAVSTRSGTDATPAAILDGAAVQDGAEVVQRIQGGVDGASYLVRCEATTSTGRVLVVAAVLPVRTLA